MSEDTSSRIEEIKEELEIINRQLNENPFNASANARFAYLNTILHELTKRFK